MIEIPESVSLARQLNDTVKGKAIASVLANASPHKFAWFFGDPLQYDALLRDKTVGEARGVGGKVEIALGKLRILLAEGVNVRFIEAGEAPPAKHQLLIAFTDSSALACTVQMYGGLWVFQEGDNDNEYYLAAKRKPSPRSDLFDLPYFLDLAEESSELSVKAFLATEQRVPGLGNGVLQDILFNARIHPKTKVKRLTEKELDTLFGCIKSTLIQMTEQGGRDTENDLFGNPGGYKTLLSKYTVGKPCPACGALISKFPYMGGSVYVCPGCQKERK
jgi:formamidopyrimidine-DNA glycosylase